MRLSHHLALLELGTGALIHDLMVCLQYSRVSALVFDW